jgi:type II secretory pathway predicted ATPase ExeA
MTASLDDLGFFEWPFAIVPDLERAQSLWADRETARAEMNVMLEGWRRGTASSIHLIWADLGAGKTHTLMRLQAFGEATGDFLPIYALLPNQTTSFIALYSAIVASLDWTAVQAGIQPGKTQISADVEIALTWLTSRIDPTRRNLAGRWLRGERLTPRECERLGVARPIRTVDDAVEALTTVLQALSAGGKRVVLMIDEYQRVAEGSRRQLQEVGHGVHTVFNACPRMVSWILSCAAGGGDVEFVLTPELVSRLSLRRIELPYLTHSDVLTYVGELFAHYRTTSFTGDPYHPFTESSVERLAAYLIDEGRLDLTPRGVNEAFDFILSGLISNDAALPIDVEVIDSWLEKSGPTLLDRVPG